jgi:hypothetical protein
VLISLHTLCCFGVIRSNRLLCYVIRASVRWSFDCTDIFHNDELTSVGLDCYSGMCKSIGGGGCLLCHFACGVEWHYSSDQGKGVFHGP